jgi:hypothetical protein
MEEFGALLAAMVALFTLNYLALGAIWRQLNKVTASLRVVCREHAANHGGKEIEL